LVLLFVFYTSFIFYYGAAFTKQWNEELHRKMRLEKHVYEYKVEEVRS
jgi:membrane protein